MTTTPGERVSPLRRRMLDEMRLANLAENTQVSYLREITCLARDCKRRRRTVWMRSRSATGCWPVSSGASAPARAT